MAKNRERLAALLGARLVGSVPDVGGGAFGMARDVARQALRPKVPVSDATAQDKGGRGTAGT